MNTIKTLPITSLIATTDYVRGEADDRRVKMLAEILGWSARETQEERTERLKNTTYRFRDPLIVTPAAAGKYRIVDGHTRMLSCALAGVINVPVRIVEDLKPDQEYTLQYTSNASHGQPFTRELRDAFIRRSRMHYKMSLDDIAQITQLSLGQVSRIAAEKSGKSKEEISKIRKTQGKKGKGKDRHVAEKGPAESFNLKAYIQECYAFVAYAKRFRKTLAVNLVKNDKLGEAWTAMVDVMTSIRKSAVEE